MSEPALSVRDLRVELDSGAAVVEELSLSVAPGEIVGLVGESGSGKTTTALALLGYTRPGVRMSRGDIQVGGRSIDARKEAAARRLGGAWSRMFPRTRETR